MSACKYCHQTNAANNQPIVEAERTSQSVRRRYLKFTKWIIPGIVLAILPKCPLCVAAYVAIGTGVSLSFNSAAWIRWIIIILCVGSFLYLAVVSASKILRKAN